MSKKKKEEQSEESLQRIIEQQSRNTDAYQDEILPKRYLLHGESDAVSFAMTPHMIEKLRVALIDRCLPGASGLSLIYSTEKHGYSLSTLISCAARGPSSGHFVLVIMEDAASSSEYERVFGAFFMNRLEYRRTSYGNTHTTLFRFSTPKKQSTLGECNSLLRVYSTNAELEGGFYIMAKKEYLAFGCSNARFGLVLDKTLRHGESHPVETFNNETLSYQEKFLIKQAELWHVRM